MNICILLSYILVFTAGGILRKEWRCQALVVHHVLRMRHIGGVQGSTACVVGGLLGAAYGVEGIPATWSIGADLWSS